MKMLKVFLPLILISLVSLIFFREFFVQGKLPIPSDTIIGLYHPFRDLYAKEYPRGIPFKNYLITDPVRQQYPWRELATSLEKKFELPLWNPYSFSGTPLLANLQSASFYPLNILLFILPTPIGWSILVILEPLLTSTFLYFYLNNLKLNKWACFLGALTFGFSGFSVAWMEWGTMLHVGLWLPLILLSIDKIFSCSQTQKISRPKADQPPTENFVWSLIFIFSLASSFFAGHLQIFFYVFTLSIAYFFARWWQHGKNPKLFFQFTIYYLLFIIITAIQWIPTLQFISQSARDIDQASWQKEGWFIPWQHLIQFFIPDFFGNPTTLNYWGIWNYGEFIGYIGIFPLLMAFFAMFFRHDKKTLFFGSIFFASLIFSLPTIFAKIPFILNMPFLSTAQPTRLVFLIDFSLAVLVTFGFDLFLRKQKGITYLITFFGLIFLIFWFFVIFGNQITHLISVDNLSVAKRNLFLPTSLFFISLVLIFLFRRFLSIPRYMFIIYIIIVGVTIFDLLRFGFKFMPLTNKDYLFPETQTTSFLQKQSGLFRIMATDSRLLPPNFLIIYRLQSVDGYDPLYLRRYGELIAASERAKPDISHPLGFNRIITPHNYQSKIIDLLGVKYILSLSDLSSPKLKKVFQEGETRIYENKNILPRVFFVKSTYYLNNENAIIKEMFKDDFDFKKKAIVEEQNLTRDWQAGESKIVFYSENKVIIKTSSIDDSFLVLTDSFYPSWHAKIDGKETKIYRTDYNFRGIIVPKGKHSIEFYISLI